MFNRTVISQGILHGSFKVGVHTFRNIFKASESRTESSIMSISSPVSVWHSAATSMKADAPNALMVLIYQ
jgi:hypothetical protein